MPLGAGAGPVNPDDCHIPPRVTGGPNLPHPRGSGDPLDAHTHKHTGIQPQYIHAHVYTCMLEYTCLHTYACT